jgi:predicted dithiol-disulfide oxidoreductase (DUF899 family)
MNDGSMMDSSIRLCEQLKKHSQGAIMESPEDHTKHLVRQYMAMRRLERAPVPSMQEIRRQLGWDLQAQTPTSSGRRAQSDGDAGLEPR